MAKTVLLSLLNRNSLSKLPAADRSFERLPFYLPNKESDFSNLNSSDYRAFRKDNFYIQLLLGIDWLIAQRVDVLNLSLGLKSNVMDPNEPIHIATKTAQENNIIVVTAAGNRGPHENSIQGIARSKSVISVGATDSNRKLLKKSSRGVPNEIAPTLVCEGLSELMKSPNFHELPAKLKRFMPSTSFACARVTRIVSFVKTVLQLVSLTFQSYISGGWEECSLPILMPRIGYADTGVPQDFESDISDVVKEITKNGANQFTIKHANNAIQWVSDVQSFLIERNIKLDISNDRKTVLKFLLDMTAPMPENQKHEVGAGYLDENIATEYFLNLTQKQFLSLTLGNKHQKEVRKSRISERSIFDQSQLDFIFHVSTQGLSSHAKVR